jgi:hypothetical protein
MSGDVRDQITGIGPSSRPQDTERWVKSYTYLRTAMVALLIALGVAVFYETRRQGFLLTSVSAYYYTPAQAIFVGTLIGLAACMIALNGTFGSEEVFLNLGGMFAAVVAIVPTSRGEDYRAALRACRELSEQELTGVDCPNVLALADATKANVENNMVALLVVGGLALVAGLLFALRDKKLRNRRGLGKGFWLGFWAALGVWLAAAVAFLASTDWFIDNAHYIAAVALVVCIVAVAIANALRHDRQQLGAASTRGEPTPKGASGTLIRPPMQLNRYAWLAWLIVVGSVIGFFLVLGDVITVFWLEIGVALLVAVFWMVQTIDPRARPAVPEGELGAPVGPLSHAGAG